jgi:biotin transport system substrate-specific component
VIAMASGLAIIFACGVLWLAWFARPAVGVDAALRTGLYPFLPVDVFKLLVAAAVMPGLWRVVGRANGGDGDHGTRSPRRHGGTE